MNDSKEASAQGAPWLLLIHSLPPKPDYLRVKIRRRLQRLGAAALKNTVYVLRNNEDALEDFEWLARAIAEEGGEATVCAASFLAGTTDEEMEHMLKSEEGADELAGPAAASTGVPRAATWVTREGVKVDRMASAWLIRRFIDPLARFKFVPPQGYKPQPGELRFDMFEGEYTHEGDQCTFETLVRRFSLEDPALAAIAEIVHDVDCKDDKFGRAEAAGVASLVQGIAQAQSSDAARLERGGAMMDDLYATFRGA